MPPKRDSLGHGTIVNVVPLSLAAATAALLVFLGFGIRSALALNIATRRSFAGSGGFGNGVFALVESFSVISNSYSFLGRGYIKDWIGCKESRRNARKNSETTGVWELPFS